MNLEAALQEAAALHQAGRLPEAARLFERVIQRAPTLAPAHNALGVVRAQQGDMATAARHFRRAAQIAPDFAEAWANLASSSRAQGRTDEALEAQLRVVALVPGHAGAQAELGALLLELGRETEAAAAITRALTLDQDCAPAHFALGNLHERRRNHAAAEAAFQRVLELAPDEPQAWFNLANAVREQARYFEAASAYRRVTQLMPGHVQAWSNLGMAIAATRDAAGADAAYARALALRPLDIGASGERDALLAADAAFAQAHSNRLMTLLYRADLAPAEIARRHLEFEAMHGAALARFRTAHANAREPGRRLRVGYVSPDFRRHSCAFFLAPLIEAHDRTAVEVFLYADLGARDETTARFERAADVWRETTALGHGALADQIRADGIDVLIDCAGHSAGNRLPAFALKPAPVQLTWLGYPAATGLDAIDARVGDDIADPPADGGGERVVRLPGPFLCYEPPTDAPPVAERAAGPVVFGSFNNLAKVTDAAIATWAAILAAVPGSRLMLKSRAFADLAVRAGVTAAFGRHGAAAERLTLAPPDAALSDHLARYGEIDVALDTFPYNGTTTTCEALWMGVPVVTLAGDRHAARVGASLLARVGLDDLVAPSAERYVAAAVALAQDSGRRAALRTGLRESLRGSTLCERGGFARNMEAAYRALWRAWCAGETT